MKLHNYYSFKNENCFDGIDYKEIFERQLKKKFPQGVKLYHLTLNSNVDSILEHGLLASKGNEIPVIHTVLGDKNINRVTSDPQGYTLLEISISPDNYGMLIPEEATYWDNELMDDCDDGDEREKLFYKVYLDSHPGLTGGDITLYTDIPPHWIKVIKIDGKEVD